MNQSYKKIRLIYSILYGQLVQNYFWWWQTH